MNELNSKAQEASLVWYQTAQAQRSVSVITSTGDLSFVQNAGKHSHPHLYVPDAVRRRYLIRKSAERLAPEEIRITVPTGELEHLWRQRALQLSGLGWEVRMLEGHVPTMDCVIIDERAVALQDVDSPGGTVVVVHDIGRIRQVQEHFDRLWVSALTTADDVVPLYEDLLSSIHPASERALFVASEYAWNSVIETLAKSPSLLYSLEPRRFEELVAEIIQRQGLDVTLTPARRDGGRDILAFCQTELGRHLYLVECKRWRPDRPVGVELVRALYGVVAHERATAGVLVTTSHFTSGARNFQSSIPHQITLKDYDDLVGWLRGAKRT